MCVVNKQFELLELVFDSVYVYVGTLCGCGDCCECDACTVVCVACVSAERV